MKIGEIEITEQDIRSIFNLGSEIIKRLRVPKNKKDKIGIVIAIKTENNKEKLRLENDLVLGLGRYLESSRLSDLFYVIQYPQGLSTKLKSMKIAGSYLNRSRGHFMVFGELIERNLNTNNNYIFRLHGVVRHAPLPNIHRDRENMRKDFTSMLPKQISFPETQELLGFDATQELLGYVIKYIIGYAAKVSWDIDLAKKLFNELYGELNFLKEDALAVALNIKEKSKNQLVECLDIEATRLYEDYEVDRKIEDIIKTKPILEKIFKLDPNHYQSHLMMAIVLFKEDKIEDAIKQLISIHNVDTAWRYSLGFLYAYQDKIDDALEQYKKASYGQSTPNVINDTEIFISEEIEKKPELIQLIFFRGLLNYKGKGDYILAKQDFESFLSNISAVKYPRLIELAKKFLSQIDK